MSLRACFRQLSIPYPTRQVAYDRTYGGVMSKKLIGFDAFGKDGELRVIVEVPRGSSVKLNYEPKLRAFSYLALHWAFD